jgi:cell division protein FtsW (lipid II flippase)
MPIFCDFYIVSGIVSVWKTIGGKDVGMQSEVLIQPSEFAKSATSLALAKYL